MQGIRRRDPGVAARATHAPTQSDRQNHLGEFPDGSVYRFEWEREWRVPRRLDLGVGCPAFLFAPETEHTQLTTALTGLGTVATQNGLPLLDPNWDEAALQEALAR